MSDKISFEELPAQIDHTRGERAVAVADKAGLVHFNDMYVMVQRSVIDGKVLVTVVTEESEELAVRIDVNDGTVWESDDTGAWEGGCFRCDEVERDE